MFPGRKLREHRWTILAVALALAVLVLPSAWSASIRQAIPFSLPWRDTKPPSEARDQEMAALENHLVLQRDVIRQYEQMLEEISAFRGALPSLYSPERCLPAGVLLRGDGDPLRRSITVGAGSRSGVSPGDPVLRRSSLLGVVTEVGPDRSKVRLVTDPASRTKAYGMKFGSEVQVEGTGPDTLRIKHRSRIIEPVAGEEVLTAQDGKIPRGLILGRILREGKGEMETLWRQAELETVMVLLEEKP